MSSFLIAEIIIIIKKKEKNTFLTESVFHYLFFSLYLSDLLNTWD